MVKSQKQKSHVVQSAKAGAFVGAMVFLATHFIPLSGYQNVMDLMHRSVLLALNVTDISPGTPGNSIGLFIYLGGWVFAIAAGAAVGAIVSSLRPASRTKHETQRPVVPSSVQQETSSQSSGAPSHDDGLVDSVDLVETTAIDKKNQYQSSPKVAPGLTRWNVLVTGLPAGCLFRFGIIAKSAGNDFGFVLMGIGFLLALPIWSVRPYWKPLLSVVAGYATADGLKALFS